MNILNFGTRIVGYMAMLKKLKTIFLALAFLTQASSFAFSNQSISVSGKSENTNHYAIATSVSNFLALDIEETDTDESGSSYFLYTQTHYSFKSPLTILQDNYIQGPQNVPSSKHRQHLVNCTFLI